MDAGGPRALMAEGGSQEPRQGSLQNLGTTPAASRDPGCQSCNLTEVNSASNQMSRRGLSQNSQQGTQPGDPLTSSHESLSRKSPGAAEGPLH